jgi:copper chaperone CopZ
MKAALTAVGTLLMALAASACCWIPALLGVGAAGSLGFSAALAPYRPLLLGMTAAFLAVGFFTVYRQGGACCTTDEAKRKRKLNIAVMWTVAALSVGSAAYPNIVAFKAAQSSISASTRSTSRTVRLMLHGLDCEACAVEIKEKLKAIPGVSSVTVDYPKRIALVGIGAPESSDATLTQAVKDAGFAATIEPQIQRTK